MKFELEKLNIDKDLEGISLKMIEQHFKLYEGYVKKTNEIREKLETADPSEANGTYSFFGELKRQETFAVNGVKLHEVYFAGLRSVVIPDSIGNLDDIDPRVKPEDDKQQRTPSPELLVMIEKDFESLEKWKIHMVASAISARGWAILAFDFKDNALHIYGADTHNLGAVWGAIPLIALDVYEHAYFIDYGVDRKSYLEAFFKNLDWDFANKAIIEYGLADRHGK